MQLGAAGILEQPFASSGKPIVFVNYAEQAAAFEFFQQTYENDEGLGLFQGPSRSGKTTLIRRYVEQEAPDCPIAVVDGSGMTTSGFLDSVLNQFGFEHKFSTGNELFNMLKVFALHQTASRNAPLVFVENVHAMFPSAMAILSELATFKVKENYALRLVLTSNQSLTPIIEAPAMESIAGRLTGDYHLAPLTTDETKCYIYKKMQTGGCFDPENVFPKSVCDEIHTASGGWPGMIDQLALWALTSAKYCPISAQNIEHPELPKSTLIAETTESETIPERNSGGTSSAEDTLGLPSIFLTHNANTLQELTLDQPRLMIGRSELNDLCIESKFVSRHHALLLRDGQSTLLIDLNSANGSFVNSRRVFSQVLKNDDVISIGNYRVKFVDPFDRGEQSTPDMDQNETVVMRELQDARSAKIRKQIEVLRAPVSRK